MRNLAAVLRDALIGDQDNEHAKGLLCQYYPKDTNLNTHSKDYLDTVAEELNNRPRKTLGYDKIQQAYTRTHQLEQRRYRH